MIMSGFSRRRDGVRSPVDSDEQRLDLPDVGTERPEVVLVVVTAHDYQHVPAVKVGLDLRKAGRLEQHVPLVLDVLDRVLSEALELSGCPPWPCRAQASTASSVSRVPAGDLDVLIALHAIDAIAVDGITVMPSRTHESFRPRRSRGCWRSTTAGGRGSGIGRWSTPRH